MTNKIIPFFRDEYGFLSNFYPCEFEHLEITYKSSENAYQANKTNSIEEKIKISKMTPGESKKYGKLIKLNQEQWDASKLKVMEIVLRLKFSNEKFRKRLLDTGDMILVEGNWWHDNFWGSCTCDKCGNVGQNNLGKLLMKIREEIKNESRSTNT